MEKLTKSVLKEIVKECLIELLAEGLSNKQTNKNRSALKETLLQKDTPKKSFKKPSYLDSINFNDSNEGKVKNKKLDEIASNVTKDPVLSEMLLDTAHTTLQEQIAAEGKNAFIPSGQGDQAQKIVESSLPEDLFGDEAASKWASLAFNS